MKRLYFLLAIATVQILLGSLTMLQAAQPVRMSQDVFVPTGADYRFEFGILGTGRLSGNLSELQGRSFDVFVFDAPGYSSFRDGSNTVPPLFQGAGTALTLDLDLPGSGSYYVVALDFPSRGELQIRLDLTIVGLKPSETVVALIVLVGGLALIGASLMLSVWAWRRAPPAANPSPDPSPDSNPGDPGAANDPPDDDTRIY